jgi:hypothetical protein
MLGGRPTGPKKLSVAQQALLTLHKIHARGMFLITNALLLLVVFYTSHRFPHKFVRVQGEYVAVAVKMLVVPF